MRRLCFLLPPLTEFGSSFSWMVQLENIGRAEICERDLLLLSLPDFHSMPDSMALSGRYFIAFLAADATSIGVDALEGFCRKLLRAGCIYFCAWGPDCERVHDIFDECVSDECANEDVLIMTTWHSEETLDSALWYSIYVAFPDDNHWDETKNLVAISVGHQDWDDQIRRRAADLDALKRDVTSEN